MPTTLKPMIVDRVRQKHAVTLAYLIMFVGFLYLVPSIPLFLTFHRSWWLIASHAFDSAVIIFLLIHLTLTRNANFAMWGMCIIDAIAIVPLALDSGIARTGLLTVTGALLVVFLLKGIAGLKFWLIGVYSLLVLAFPLHMLIGFPLPYTQPQYLYFLLMEALAIILLWVYGTEKSRLDRELAKRTRELETAKASVEQKVRERTHELAESEAKLSSTIQSLTTIGLLMVDRHYHILIKNSALDSTLGYGKSWTFADFAGSLGGKVELKEQCERVFAEAKPVIIPEVPFGTRILRLGLNPVFDGADAISIVISAQDITEQKVLERSKDEFFSIASHELRTPLTAIRGNMSMVKDLYPEVMKDSSLASMVDDTHAASVRLIEIVNDFLDMSKLEQGKIVFQIGPLSVGPIVGGVCNDLKPLLNERNDKIELKNLDSLPMIKADEARFRQVVYNLLSNAIKYSENGTITVEGAHDTKQVRISVSDTGKGIPVDSQKLLFHKFQQAGESILTRDNTKGTGLGLYISRLLADNMRGSVDLVRSEPGVGTTFMITMPIAKPSGKHASQPVDQAVHA